MSMYPARTPDKDMYCKLTTAPSPEEFPHPLPKLQLFRRHALSAVSANVSGVDGLISPYAHAPFGFAVTLKSTIASHNDAGFVVVDGVGNALV
jgi:hypothetical protein